MHIRQPEVASGVAVGELLMVDSKEVQHGGMKIVNVHGIVLHVHTELVGGSVGQASFHTTTGKQIGKGRTVMIPPWLRILLSLGKGRPPKLATKDHERVVQKATLFEIRDQGGSSPVGIGTELGVPRIVILVGIPGLIVSVTGVIDRRKTYSALSQSTGQKAGIGKPAPVISGGFRFVAKIQGIARLHLHRVGRFHRPNLCLQLESSPRSRRWASEPSQQIKLPPLLVVTELPAPDVGKKLINRHVRVMMLVA